MRNRVVRISKFYRVERIVLWGPKETYRSANNHPIRKVIDFFLKNSSLSRTRELSLNRVVQSLLNEIHQF